MDNRENDPRLTERVVEAIEKLDRARANGTRSDYLALMASVKATVGEGADEDTVHEAYRGFCQTSGKYIEAHFDRDWNSLTPDGGITPGTMFMCSREDEAAGLSPESPIPPPVVTTSRRAMPPMPLKAKAAAENNKKDKKAYPSEDAAIAAAEAQVPGGKIVATYKWPGPFDRLRLRIETSNGAKEFRAIHRLGKRWYVGDPASKPLPLYRSDQLPAEGILYVVEGEKAADAGWAKGLPCVTSGGSKSAAGGDWFPLAGRDVVILPDNDPDGEAYANAVACILLRLKCQVWIVRLPDLGPGGDLYDFVEPISPLPAHVIQKKITTLVKATSPLDALAVLGGAELIRFADITSRPVSWLWQNRIPAGCVSLLVAPPGSGKTFAACDMSATVSTGSPWPDGSPCQQGSVIFITGEDDPAMTLRPRLETQHADLSNVRHLGRIMRLTKSGISPSTFTLADVPYLEERVRELGDCRLIVIDPIGSFLGRDTDAYRDNEVRAVLGPLNDLAAKYGLSVVVIAHRRKGNAGSADESTLGSVAMVGLARAVYHIMPDRKHPHRRLFLPGKQNLGPSMPGLAFTIGGDPAALTWEKEPVATTADEEMQAARSGGERRAPRLGQAVAWLRTALSVGPVPSKHIEQMASEEGISTDTLNKAKVQLKIRPRNTGTGWEWSLPTSNSDSDQAA